MYERIGKTNRDIFDVYFFFKQNWEINRDIVEHRSGMKFRELIYKCIALLESVDNKYILDGLGELINESQKDWARAKYYRKMLPHDAKPESHLLYLTPSGTSRKLDVPPSRGKD